MRTPEQIFKEFKRNAESYISAEESYILAAINPEAKEKARIKIDSAKFHLKTLKAICEVK